MYRSLLPPGHPCGFARAFLEDPFVRQGVEIYDALVKQKDELMKAGQFQEAWNALMKVREIERELGDHCEKLMRQRQKPDSA